MQQLPDAFNGMAAYPQFILRDGKHPIDWRTGRPANAHDPDIWLGAVDAIAAAAQRGPTVGIGFVFTEQDPFWFLDIDHAVGADGQWSAVAQQLLATFPDAAVEISPSGQGLHIIGSGSPPEHGCKNKAFGVELYHQNRYATISGNQTRGDCTSQAPAALEWLVSAYFSRGAAGVEFDELTTGPVAEWRGPVDDEDLLRRAMQSKSTAGLFGARASFADLWTANRAALDATYGGDASSEDMALMQHLAFWTGKHGERMVRLMQRSGLAREKWTRHRAYLRMTCLSAMRLQGNVLQDKPPESVDAPVATGARVTQREVTGGTFLSPSQQVETFAGCVYVSDQHSVLVPGGDLLDHGRFRVHYGGFTFAMDTANERTVRDAWEAFTESQALRPPRADTTCFFPQQPAGALVKRGGRTMVNQWWPVDVERVAGPIEPFMKHLRLVLPDPRDAAQLLAYLAACVQHKGVKFQWAPLLQGVEGNGKTFFSHCVMNAVGMRYSHMPRPMDISNKFNPWLRNKLVIAIEDVYAENDRAEIFEVLKPMITGSFQAVEPKGLDQVMAEIVANFIFNSNHKDGVRKTPNDRRIAPFFCAQQSMAHLHRDGMDRAYFANLYHWYQHGGMPVVNELLHTWQIPDELNPALGGIAPLTTSTAEAIGSSRGTVEQHVMEAIEQGKVGFIGGWISSNYLDKLLDDLGMGRRIPLIKRRALLQSLGYDWHPALPEGRVHNMVLPDGGKPRLFIREGHLATALDAASATRAYSAAQLGMQPA